MLDLGCMKKTTKTFSAEKKVTITIQISEFQSEILNRLCTRTEGLAVPRATMAGAAFVRGLTELRKELPVELPELG